jgi:hypothetical protein
MGDRSADNLAARMPTAPKKIPSRQRNTFFQEETVVFQKQLW